MKTTYWQRIKCSFYFGYNNSISYYKNFFYTIYDAALEASEGLMILILAPVGLVWVPLMSLISPFWVAFKHKDKIEQYLNEKQ